MSATFDTSRAFASRTGGSEGRRERRLRRHPSPSDRAFRRWIDRCLCATDARRMTSMPIALPSPTDLAPLEQLVERARGYAADSRAPATRRAYLHDWDSFAAWCAAHGLDPLPASPATVAVYLSAQPAWMQTSLPRKLPSSHACPLNGCTSGRRPGFSRPLSPPSVVESVGDTAFAM